MFAVFSRRILVCTLFLLVSLAVRPLYAAPGFYVTKDEKKPEGSVSTIVIAYDSGRMVMTIESSVSGTARDLALVIPVPGFIGKEQIHVTSGDLIRKLDAYSALRLTASEDPNPCTPEGAAALGAPSEGNTVAGVKVEPVREEGNYDITLLSAAYSGRLIEWLKEKGWRLPKGGETLLRPYIDRQFHFIVAKLTLPEGAGRHRPRPLQLAYNAPKFALPLRLAALHAPENSGGEQDLLIFTLTRGGKVEAANLRNALLPEGREVPEFIAADFNGFAEALFRRAAMIDMSAAYLEFAGDAGACSVCPAPALKKDELRELGALWLEADAGSRIVPLNPEAGMSFGNSGAWLTRLHLRYRPGAVPDDLQLRETQDRKVFQPRFIVRKVWKGEDSACPVAPLYKQAVAQREQQLAQNLARLTGWPVADIGAKMNAAKTAPAKPDNEWWKGMWKK